MRPLLFGGDTLPQPPPVRAHTAKASPKRQTRLLWSQSLGWSLLPEPSLSSISPGNLPRPADIPKPTNWGGWESQCQPWPRTNRKPQRRPTRPGESGAAGESWTGTQNLSQNCHWSPMRPQSVAPSKVLGSALRQSSTDFPSCTFCERSAIPRRPVLAAGRDNSSGHILGAGVISAPRSTLGHATADPVLSREGVHPQPREERQDDGIQLLHLGSRGRSAVGAVRGFRRGPQSRRSAQGDDVQQRLLGFLQETPADTGGSTPRIATGNSQRRSSAGLWSRSRASTAKAA